MSANSSHTAFRIAAEALQAHRQMRLSVATLMFLTLAIGLGASAISPQAGWVVKAPQVAIGSAPGWASVPDGHQG